MDNKVLIKNIMPPLWIMYPDILNGSMYLNTGSRESYSKEFHNWFNELSTEEKDEYKRLFPYPIQWNALEEKRILEHGDYSTYIWSLNNKQKYCIKEIQEDFNAGKKLELIFFLEHASPLDGSIAQNCFCQWFRSEFKYNNHTYSNMEQYMMSEKAKLFGDKNIYKAIINESSPKMIKMLGREVHGFNEVIWNNFKYNIVLNGNYHKFMQNKELKKYLLSTKDKIIVEASPSDRIWGIGMDKYNENIENPTKWRGENLLGFALMEVRDEIERVCKNEHLIEWEKYRQAVVDL